MKPRKIKKQIYLKAAKLVFEKDYMIGEAISIASNTCKDYLGGIKYIADYNYPEANLFRPINYGLFYSKEERVNALLFSHEMI